MAVLGLRFCARAFSSCGKGGHSSSRCAGLSLSRPLLLRSTGSRRAGSVILLTGSVAPRHVGSSQTRARTRVPCIGRQILNHCATREAQYSFSYFNISNSVVLLEPFFSNKSFFDIYSNYVQFRFINY